ncbi:hypothetical protein [Nocardia sp. IFM 10818]
MSDPEIERLRLEIAEEKLSELRSDRKEILSDLDAAETPEEIAFAEKQLEGIDQAIGEVLDRLGQLRKRPPKAPPPASGRLF